MEKTLQLMLNKQAEFQKKFGYEEGDTDIKKMSDLIHTHGMFAIEEVFEMLRELPFHKPWRDYSQLTDDEIKQQLKLAKEEWTDVLIFVINMGLFLGLDEDEILELYLEKNGLNKKRQEDPGLGYIKGGK